MRTLKDLTLKNTNNQIEKFINDYNRSRKEGNYTLRNVYTSWSEDKEKAYQECIEIMQKYNGYGGYITSHNLNYFSFGFTCTECDKEVLYIITKNYIYKMKY